MNDPNDQLMPLQEIAGDLFVNREYELDMFWEWATGIPHPVTYSHALVGRRRTGKTAILHRLFNRLFYEQERVVPVYVSFADYLHRKRPITAHEFARDFFAGYVACYLAFRYRQPMLVRRLRDLSHLHKIAHQMQDEFVLDLYEQYKGSLAEPLPHVVVQWAINMPRAEAYIYKIPMVLMIDEFQVLTDVKFDEQVSHDVTDSFQRAAESRWAPLLLSGSSVSLLVGQALTGLLSGRVGAWHLAPLDQEHAIELVFRIGKARDIRVNEELAEVVWQLTKGYPYSIERLMYSEHPARRDFPALDALEEVMRFELTDMNGKLWQHYYGEFEKYSDQLNERDTTRRMMLLATKYPGQRLTTRRAAEELGIEVKEAREALEKLHWADVVEKIGLISYQGPSDPMMRRFIEYQYRAEIQDLSRKDVVKDWHEEYQRLQGHTNHLIGKLAESYVGAVMRGFDGREVDGATYFNHPEPVTLPVFEDIERRTGIIEEGVPIEIDLAGEWDDGQRAWVVQVRYTKVPMGEAEVHRFLEQTGDFVAKREYASVTRWYFCKQGYTAEGARALEDAGVLYSDREQFNSLANLFGFLGLPV